MPAVRQIYVSARNVTIAAWINLGTPEGQRRVQSLATICRAAWNLYCAMNGHHPIS
jgi:hypothetical protein